MVSDDTDEHRVADGEAGGFSDDADDEVDAHETQEPGGRRAITAEDVDQRIVDLLSWILDTETRAKIYVYLLANPGSTSEEVAQGTGLYPSTVREALAELHEEARVTRDKRASEGAGNNPYQYTAIQPSELVGGVVDQVQRELNTIFTLDRLLDRDRNDEPFDEDVEPVTIVVDDSQTGDREPVEDADRDDLESGHDGETNAGDRDSETGSTDRQDTVGDR